MEFFVTTLDMPATNAYGSAVPVGQWNGSPPATVATVGAGLDYNMWVAMGVTKSQRRLRLLRHVQEHVHAAVYRESRAVERQRPLDDYSADDEAEDLAAFNVSLDDRKAGLSCFINFLFSTKSDGTPWWDRGLGRRLGGRDSVLGSSTFVC